MSDPAARRALVAGWLLLAIAIPMGATLEALHAYKVQGYLASSVRRELWTLSHAHGNLLGILCIAFASVAERAIADPRSRARIAARLVAGALLLPAGFFLGGILNSEGDPSPGIVLVPLGALALMDGLVRAALAVAAPPPDRGTPKR